MVSAEEALSTQLRQLQISPAVEEYCTSILGDLESRFREIDRIAEINQLKVLSAMQKAHIGEANLLGTTGYGYDDIGRDGLEACYAAFFKTEEALVRPQITCGTHALALALMGNLRPGDEMLSGSGHPYDTLEEVIGIRPSRGSLAEYGITYREAALASDGHLSLENICNCITGKTRLVEIQRSRGYSERPTLSVAEIGEAAGMIHEIDPHIIVMVDNCYGEFTETVEPSEVGADMVVGSLIKNPGGGLAPTGGYIAGTSDCVRNAAVRLTSPGLGKEVGASLGILPSLYEGFFIAPSVTASAVKGAVFAAAVYESLGYSCYPSSKEARHDIVQAITFNDPAAEIAFCQGIQAASPVDSYAVPQPDDMPGYDSQVIMAAGAFVSGSTMELSSDGPIRPPYTAYYQGGLTWAHAKYGIMRSVQSLLDHGLINL